MKKLPSAKLTAIILTSIMVTTLLIQIPTVVAASPDPNHGGPYHMDEGESENLNGSVGGSYEKVRWYWENYPENARFTNRDTLTPKFFASDDVDNQHEKKKVFVELVATDENGNIGRVNTTVSIRNLLKARPKAPDEVVEGESIVLDGSDSGGLPDGYRWSVKSDWFVDEPTAELENGRQKKAVLHAPDMMEVDREVEVELMVYEGDNSHSSTITVNVKDPVIADIRPESDSLYEGENIWLYGDGSSGSDGSVIDEYGWSRIEDPTEDSELKKAKEENARFFAQEEVDGNKTIKIKLLVTDSTEDGKSDSENLEITVIDELVARPGGPYELREGGENELDGTESSGNPDEYDWYLPNPPDGVGWKSGGGSSATPTLEAEEDIVETSESFEVELTVSDENGKTHSRTTEVEVKPAVISRPKDPYRVAEYGSVQLDGTESEGENLSYEWKIIDDPTEKAYLTGKNTAEPTFHALDGLEEEKTVELELTVTDEENITDSATSNVTIKRALVAKAEDASVKEGESVELDGTGSIGDIKNYEWTILEDPSGGAMLTENNTVTPTFHAPETADEAITVRVRLLVSNEVDYDNKTIQVKVKPSVMAPDSPENLRVEGEIDPESVGVPQPKFSSKYVITGDASAERVQIQVGTSENGSDMWDSTIKDLEVTPNDSYEIEYDGAALEPEKTYYWRMRYYANDEWGDWSDGTAQFTMDSLESIINTGVEEGQRTAVADTLLQVDTQDAAQSLKDADRDSAAAVLEVTPVEDRAELILTISGLPGSPKTAADILNKMTTQRVAETVKELVNQEEFEELDKIFQEMDGILKDQIFKSGVLEEDEEKKLYEELSEKAKEGMTYEPEWGGLNWLLIGGIIGAVAAAVFGLFIFTGGLDFLEVGKEKKEPEEKEEGRSKKSPGKKKWAGIIKKFLKSGQKQAGIKTEIPAKQAVKSFRSTIRELGGENIVGAKEENGKVYLVRKS